MKKININQILEDIINGKYDDLLNTNDNIIFTERNEDYIETLIIRNIIFTRSLKEDEIKWKVIFHYDYNIDYLEGRDNILITYKVNVVYNCTMNEDDTIKSIDNIEYDSIKKTIEIFYNSFEYQSLNTKDITEEEYKNELDNFNTILGQEEKDIIEYSKYGDYDSIVMEVLGYIIRDRVYDILECKITKFSSTIGYINDRAITVTYTVNYIDDPVCYEELASGYLVDFIIEVNDDKYLLTYNIFIDNMSKDNKVYRIKDLITNKYIYNYTFTHRMQDLDESLTRTDTIKYRTVSS